MKNEPLKFKVTHRQLLAPGKPKRLVKVPPRPALVPLPGVEASEQAAHELICRGCEWFVQKSFMGTDCCTLPKMKLGLCTNDFRRRLPWKNFKRCAIGKF